MSEGEPPTDGERPRWSFTWLLRIQRTGRNRLPRGAGQAGPGSTFSRLFPWAVLLILLIELALGIWLGHFPL